MARRAVAVLLPSILVALCALSCDDAAEPDAAATIARWRSTGKLHREGISGQMVRDGVLTGKTRAEVEKLLGPRDAADQYGQGEWCFEIGENGLDVVWLRLDFKDDCVFSARMVAD